MLIEIRKTEFINKGSELMLYAILKKMKETYPSASFVMAPTVNRGTRPYLKRAELGLLQKASLSKYRLLWDLLAAMAPKKIREMYGVVLDSEIDMVLDAAGFSYSDQWGIDSTKELADSCKRWHKRGTKIVLLPQAFGPFKSLKIKDLIRSAVDNVDLIFPRDTVSYQHLTDVVGERPNIIIAPDFTNLLEGILPGYFECEENRFCIIPNYRMIDKTSPPQSAAYLPFMIKCAKYLISNGVKPFILVHEGSNDLLLAQQITEGVGSKMHIMQERHPLKIKGILGACAGTIGSRFHGLVSALSQGVPSLATGWSHKYRMLFHDYGFDEGLMDVMGNDDEIHKKVDLITAPDSRKKIQSILNAKSNELKTLSEKMWAKVIEVLKN